MTAFEIISVIIGILSLLVAFGSLIVAFLAFLDIRKRIALDVLRTAMRVGHPPALQEHDNRGTRRNKNASPVGQRERRCP